MFRCTGKPGPTVGVSTRGAGLSATSLTSHQRRSISANSPSSLPARSFSQRFPASVALPLRSALYALTGLENGAGVTGAIQAIA